MLNKVKNTLLYARNRGVQDETALALMGAA
jgi:hypothetical protein